MPSDISILGWARRCERIEAKMGSVDRVAAGPALTLSRGAFETDDEGGF